MDNVTFHKSKGIRDIFIDSTNKLLFIPPYSPQYNPIELVFAQIKKNIHNIRNYKDIVKKIEHTIKTTNRKHLTNYYNHCF